MKYLIFVLYLVLVATRPQLALAQLNSDAGLSQSFTGFSLDGSIKCELTLAPSYSYEGKQWATLDIETSGVCESALGDSESGLPEMISAIAHRDIHLPNAQNDIVIYRNSPTSIYTSPNTAKSVFLFSDAQGNPKMVKGVIFFPKYQEFSCGFSVN